MSGTGRRDDGASYLRLSRRGPDGRMAFWLAWAAFALLPVALAGATVWRSAFGTPGSCEVDRVGMLGLAIACAALAWWLAKDVPRALALTQQARRFPGAVRLDADALVLDVPWWSAEPVAIPRHVVEEVGPRDRTLGLNGDLALGFRMGPTVVRFTEPVGFPTAVDVPVPHRSIAWPPRSVDALTSISLAFESQPEADRALERWLEDTARSSEGSVPQPLPRRFAVPWGSVMAWLLVVAGGLVVWASVPSGC